jgi:sulfatase maturation enzyme AslB (radical SAM superfamily)
MICLDAFKNVNITRDNGELHISPCCIAPLKKVNQLDFQNDQYLVAVRDAWSKQQWPDACVKCLKQEQQGLPSRRQHSNQWYKDHGVDQAMPELIRLDYWVGDICNLACVMCGPWASSVWKQELNLPQKRFNNNQYWQELDLSRLQYVHFHGGEPLLSKEHRDFLAAIPNKQQVHVYYNTNATIQADNDLRDLWNEFRLIELDFSIDAIGDQFNYIRYPADWHAVSENLTWYREHAGHNCLFAVTTVVSVLNQDHVPELAAWLQSNFASSRFGDPVEHRLQPCEGVLAVDSVPEHTVKYLDQLDLRRQLDWRKLFPSAAEKLLS